MTIVLKHLAQEFKIDPRVLRAILREANLTPKAGRWKWDKEDKQLIAIRLMLGKRLSKKQGVFTRINTKPKL